MVGMLRSFIIAIYTFISNLFHAVWTVLEPDPPAQGLSLLDFMEKLSRRQLAVKQLKEQFTVALQTNNTEEVLQILHTGKLDIDTVLEVDDPSMILASYKQGEMEGEEIARTNILHAALQKI